MPTKGDDDYAVRLREDAAGWRRVSDDIRLTPDDPVLDGLTEQEADDLVNGQWALVPHDPDQDEAEPPFDPSEHTVSELKEQLDENDYSAVELDALAAAEAAGKDRETAHDAIDNVREE
jgi:hypothetical protein